jgi:hypothetical protein
MTRHTHFVAARPGRANLTLPTRFVATVDPQVYYPRSDNRDGIYVNSRVTLAQRDLPVSISGMVNRPVHTDIARGAAFLWNVSLNYASRPTL